MQAASPRRWRPPKPNSRKERDMRHAISPELEQSGNGRPSNGRNGGMKRFTTIVAGLGMLSLAAPANALPLCGAGFGACRPGLEFAAFAGGLAVEGALNKAKDGAGAIGHFNAGFAAFEEATAKLNDPSLSDHDKCVQAGAEDERGLAE